MDKTYLDELTSVLQKDERLVNGDGKLLKTKITEYAHNLDPALMELIVSNEKLKTFFFKKIKDVLVFNQDKFLTFVHNEAFLKDSFTAFKNKIGLATSRYDYVIERSEVVLNWPYKDCVLEGGQDKEDQKRDEVFWNETLGADQQDTLLAPKVFDGYKKYDKSGENKVSELSETDNLVLGGNNLLVLHSLKKRYAGKVQLIYIDPPFNTEKDSFKYNDRFTHSAWLTFMKNRLEIAKTLLSDTGLIYVHIDHNEAHYLKVLCDEVFGRKNFVNEVIWGYRIQGISKNAWPKKHDNIFVYRKSDDYKFHSEKETIKYDKPFIDTQVLEADISKLSDAEKSKINELLSGNKPLPDKYKDILFNKYYSEVYVRDVWDHDSTKPMISGSNEFRDFRTQKPEGLIKRIMASATNEGDLVLDFFGGSGTTAAVAHKMGRRYIVTEQMASQAQIIQERLVDVISGEQEGISKDINWTGGGSFVYAHLKNDVNVFIKKAEKITSSQEASELLDIALSSNFLSFRVDPGRFEKDEFAKLPLSQQKTLLIELVNKNKLYVNYHDIDDASYKIDVETKKINKWLQSRG